MAEQPQVRSSCREIHVSGHASSMTQHMENCTQPGDTILLVPAPILVHDGRPDFGCIKDDGGVCGLQTNQRKISAVVQTMRA